MLNLRSVSLVFILVLSACTTAVESNPARTATEELLISRAADQAAENLYLTTPHGSKIFVDATNFDGTDSKYAIAAIHESLLKKGAALVSDKKDADTVIEIRAGALSIDQKQFLIGVPQFNIPIPLASSALTVPQLALYGNEDQKGVAKFAMVGYDAKTGLMDLTEDPQYGFTHRTKHTVLLFITWTDSDAYPTDDEDVLTHKKEKVSSP